MPIMIWLIAAIVVVAAMALLLRNAKAGGTAPAAGTLAPDFTLNSQEGKPVRLSELKGKWVVLYFYPKDFTPGCTVEAHNFQRDLSQFEQKNAVILGVNTQDENTHQKFCTKEGLNFKLLADTKSAVSARYGSVINLAVAKLSARHTFLIDPAGTIRKVFLDVIPATHSAELLAALTELQRPSASR
jgi:thioredoxin-dependent peroxiredoxin